MKFSSPVSTTVCLLAHLLIHGLLSLQASSAQSTGGFADVGPGVTGGAGGETVTVTNGEQLKQYADAKEPYVIQVSGTVQINGMDTHVRPNKTIIGLGTNATLEGKTVRKIIVVPKKMVNIVVA